MKDSIEWIKTMVIVGYAVMLAIIAIPLKHIYDARNSQRSNK